MKNKFKKQNLLVNGSYNEKGIYEIMDQKESKETNNVRPYKVSMNQNGIGIYYIK